MAISTRFFRYFVATANYLVSEMISTHVGAGGGNPEALIDELNPDSQLYRWVSRCVYLLRTASGIFANEIEITEEANSLLSVDDLENIL